MGRWRRVRVEIIVDRRVSDIMRRRVFAITCLDQVATGDDAEFSWSDAQGAQGSLGIS